MVLVKHLISPASLTKPPIPLVIEQLSILSYNVLLPNSVDGWWTFKMYYPPLPEELQYQSSWEYRSDLLKKRIEVVNADVVCFQEVSPKSFKQDFLFMKELGYDGVELFKKGRFRPATFWKTSYCELAVPSVHKDRCLITAFRVNSSNDDEGSTQQNWYVCNCHLQAGNQGPRRVRQMNEAVRGVMTMARKQKEPNPETSVRLIVCGDFNGGSECGAVRFLEDGFIDETFVEDGEPVSSGRKDLPLASPMVDAATMVKRCDDGPSVPPATLVVSELMENLMEEASYENPVLSSSMLDRLERIYNSLASSTEGGGKKTMRIEDVEKWLVMINKELGRGDEYREAAVQMGYIDPNPDDSYEERKKRIRLPEKGVLSLEGFVEVYRKELKAGKFWGIAHDLAVLGDPLPYAGVFTARFDRLYYSAALQPTAVLDTVSEKPCPNGEESSDHLPVAAGFQVVS